MFGAEAVSPLSRHYGHECGPSHNHEGQALGASRDRETVHGKKIPPPRVFGHNSAPLRLIGTRIGGNSSYRSPGAF